MKSVLITGASGLLGQYLCRYFADRDYKVTGLYNSLRPELSHIQLLKLDLTDAVSLKTLVQKVSPQFIIHTAGYTSVDDCETNPSKAHDLNVVCTKNLCEAIAGTTTRFVQISTDHLFSGKEANTTEETEVEPLNIYAETKWLAEKEALKVNNSVIIRTNFYGGHTDKKMSFSSWIINELKQGKKISMFDDVFFTPISLCGLAKNIELLMNSDLKGIYNVVGSERLSKYDFAMKLADFFELPKSLIVKSTIENIKLKAPRPKDMSLSISKIKKDLKNFESENVLGGLKKIKSQDLI